MALLTEVTIDDARRLGAAYGLEVARVAPILAGSVNTNVELSLADGSRAFLRVYEEQTVATAAGEAALLDYLAGRGVVTPRPLVRANASGFIAEHAGKPVAVFPWVDGEILCQKRVTVDAAAQVGEALARVHLAGEAYGDAPPTRFGVAELEERILSLRTRALPEDIAGHVERLAARLPRYARRADAASGWSLVHGDLFRDNVLWQNGRIVALLDFESASRESRPFDLMVTVLSWCFGDALDLALVRAMIQGYVRVRPLADEEARSLYDEGCFAALRFGITRITDFELRPRGSGVYKDFRRFLARADALDALGADRLREMATA